MALTDALLEGLTFPFKDERWLLKTWPLLFLPFFPILGVVSILLFEGWRVATIRSISMAPAPDTLPPCEPGRWLKDGVILWLVKIVYLLTPYILVSVTGVGGLGGLIGDVGTLDTEGFWAWLEQKPYDLLWTLLIFALWSVVASPLYHAGLLRYALTGQRRTLLNLPGNLLLVTRYLPNFLLMYLSWLAIIFFIALVDIMLGLTGIGLLILPAATFILFYTVSSHELGRLAQKLKKAEEPMGNMGQQSGVIKYE